MTWLSWVREKLMGGSRRDPFREAIAATDEATHRTRSVREQLEPYRLERDPFAAIVRKRIIAEEFERAQEADTPKAR